MSARALRAAGIVSAAAMLLVVAANLNLLGATCDAFLSSDVLDCVPGRLMDIGHATAAFAASVVCVGLVSSRSLSRAEKSVAIVGFAIMAFLGTLHLVSLTGLLSHNALFRPLVILWVLAGIWMGLQSVRRRPFDLLSVVGVVLAVTALAWAEHLYDGGADGSVFNDGLLVAGGGFFALAYPYWIAALANLGPHRGSGHRDRFRDPAHPFAASIQFTVIALLLALATAVVLLPFWAIATFRPIIGDPSWPVHVTNGAAQALSVALDPDSHRVLIESGETENLEMGFEPRDLVVVAFDLRGQRVYCQAIRARDLLHARLRLTVTAGGGACSGG